jgi:hypothetical protein
MCCPKFVSISDITHPRTKIAIGGAGMSIAAVLPHIAFTPQCVRVGANPGKDARVNFAALVRMRYRFSLVSLTSLLVH